ncbi:pyridoxal-dependent decarboxylase [soil metagenome]
MSDTLSNRQAPIAMEADAFRELGHQVIDQLSEFLVMLPDHRVAPGKTPPEIRSLLPEGGLPEYGTDVAPLLLETLALLKDNLAFNGHPRFWGYITASPTPIGMLADLISSALNPNCALWTVSPLATEIELQTAQWLAEFVGYPLTSGGVMSSGGQWANYIGLLVARQAKAPWDVRALGSSDGSGRRLCIYASVESHGWLKAAANIFGFGQQSLRWIPTTSDQSMDLEALAHAVAADQAAGNIPMAVVGVAGTVGTGAIDPLVEIGDLCERAGIWFHVDGAYGAPAIAVPGTSERLVGLRRADSVAIDPHKWLYAPIDAGCTLVRDPELLTATFSSHPEYYYVGGERDSPPVNLHEIGPENSRRFRALKVWLALRQVGRSGYVQMIGDDIALTQRLFHRVAEHPELEARTLGLSIATFRYVPAGVPVGAEAREAYLNRLNRELLLELVRQGELLISNAIVNGTFLLRACIVNFRTSAEDVDALPAIVARVGAEMHQALREREA